MEFNQFLPSVYCVKCLNTSPTIYCQKGKMFARIYWPWYWDILVMDGSLDASWGFKTLGSQRGEVRTERTCAIKSVWLSQPWVPYLEDAWYFPLLEEGEGAGDVLLRSALLPVPLVGHYGKGPGAAGAEADGDPRGGRGSAVAGRHGHCHWRLSRHFKVVFVEIITLVTSQ